MIWDVSVAFYVVVDFVVFVEFVVSVDVGCFKALVSSQPKNAKGGLGKRQTLPDAHQTHTRRTPP